MKTKNLVRNARWTIIQSDLPQKIIANFVQISLSQTTLLFSFLFVPKLVFKFLKPIVLR